MATRTDAGKRRTNGRRGNGHANPPPSFSNTQKPMLPVPQGTKAGSLVIIGGHEDKEGERAILREVCARAGHTKLVVATVATAHHDEVWDEYRRLFKALGVRSLAHLHVESRADAFSTDKLAVLDGAGAVFFTGGDLLRITSRIGGAPVCDRIREIFLTGGVIAGASGGGSGAGGAMVGAGGEKRVVAGGTDESHRCASLKMAPGLGFLRGVIIDQHFAERGRLGRLGGAVPQNPRVLGIGIDEDTAILAESQGFSVIGSGAVYVVDGMRESYTNLSE